jgi:hypothetical protein
VFCDRYTCSIAKLTRIKENIETRNLPTKAILPRLIDFMITNNTIGKHAKSASNADSGLVVYPKPKIIPRIIKYENLDLFM